MAKKLLEDMIRRKPTPPVQTSEPVRTSSPPPVMPEPTKVPEPAKVLEPVLPPEPAKVPARAAYEQPQYSDVETKFASINDVSSDARGDGKSRYALWLVAVASALFLVFALSFLFSNAKITVNPKIQDIASDVDLSAVKDGGPGDLPFDLVVISGEEHKTVPAGEQKDVSIAAKGTVVLYNAFGSASQALDINTRLEGSNGKIYKTLTPTTVPGMKGSTPGSVEVGIYGAEGGPNYNSGPLDFKIFGFKGTPKYAKFYGRSKGDITGGFQGKSSDVSDADKAQIIADLRSALQAKLLSKAAEQIPSGFVLFKGGAILDTNNDNLQLTPGTGNTATASLSGTLSGFLFDAKKLTAQIAGKILPTEDANMLYIQNLKDLNFMLTNKDSSGADIANISFNISGNAKVVWKVDTNKLVNDLLSQPKKYFNTVLSNYPNIDSAQLVIRPFWKTSLPTKPGDINVIVNYPQ